MNASSTSPPPTLVDEDNIDSDINGDDLPRYYQPISAADDDGEGDHREDSNHSSSDEEYHAYDPHALENGHCALEAANGISSVQLNEEADQKSSEEEEDEISREASDAAMRRAFRDDETRRNAPLSSENAMRVMEAMRGVSFRGLAPAWTDRIPEDQWIDLLRRSRQSPPVQN